MKRIPRFLVASLLVLSFLPIIVATPANAAYAFTSHTFTPCGASGISGPTQTACTTAYTTTWDDNSSNFSVSAGIQLWTVPGTGKYRFEIAGGSSPLSGRGRIIQFETNLTDGQQLKILVGQKSSCYLSEGCGGGGGSFVVDTSANIIGIAGGGGGYGTDATGSTTSSGGVGYPSTNTFAGAPASGGAGGGKGGNGDGNSGAGYSGNGSTNSSGVAGPIAFISGGTATAGYDSTSSGKLGNSVGNGGFGGGGGAWYNAAGGAYTRSGGGGGYSGGGAGGYGGGAGLNGGGGGASYITGSATTSNWSYGFNPINTDGYVTITSLGPSITSFAPRNTLTNSTSITYDLTFSEAVTGLATADFSKSGTGSSTCAIGSPSGSGSAYSIILSGCSPGTVTLTIAANAVTNAVPQTAPAANTDAPTVTIDQTAPIISSVVAPANATYKPSDTPTFTMNFSESVTITGTPRLVLTVGSQTKYATYVSMTDSKTALFRYTVSATVGEFDTDGIVVNTTLDPNGGSILDLATNTMSVFTFTAPTLTSVLVMQAPSAPTIDSIVATSGTLTVYFTPGASNGSTITSYQYSTNGTVFKSRSPSATTSPLVITTVSTGVTNLVDGTGYQIRLRALTSWGSGDSSTIVNETPTAVSVTGDSTLVLTYGNSASTGAYSATGGTSTYTWSLGSVLTGVSLSGTTVTASSATPAGTYTQTVRATDGNSQVGSKTLTITVNKASTSISIALPNSATNAALGGAITITATVPRSGAVNFMLGGTTISGCGSASAASTTATCSWTPGALGSVSLTATFTPTDSSNFETSTTTTLAITVVNGVSTVTLSLTGGVTQAPKGQAINIIAAIDQAGKVSFYADGKRIVGCYNISATAGNKSCSWKPAVQKQVNLTATLNPTNNVYNNSTSTLTVWVIRRSGTR